MTGKKNSRKDRRKAAGSWLLPMLIVALLGMSAALYVVFSSEKTPTRRQFDGDAFAAQLREAARQTGSRILGADDPISREHGIFIRHWRFESQSAREAAKLCSRIAEEGRKFGKLEEHHVSEGAGCGYRLDLEGEAFDLVVGTAAAKAPKTGRKTASRTTRHRPSKPTPVPGSTGKLAILLDDAGQQMHLVPVACALPKEIAVAVLPFLPSSAETAAALRRAGREVWLHMPMEPEGYPAENPGPGAILISMPEADVRRTLRSALNNVPYVVGINNHMGSRATADLRLMTWVMQELKVRNLFFIDSRTTVKTCALDAARAQGIPSNRRRVFLDNDHSMAAISAQLEDAVNEARRYGEAIAIGHFKETTIRLLAKEAPGLQARGVSLVAPGKLMH